MGQKRNYTEIRKYFVLRGTKISKFMRCIRAILRGKRIALNAYMKRSLRGN